jgi:cyclopropane-fatty-acyl-phospholipid synthase
MSVFGLTTVLRAVERGSVPDFLVRAGIRRLVSAGLRTRAQTGVEGRQRALDRLLDEMRRAPIAVHTDAANAQHYELPPEFFELCLGRYRKYSGCYWPPGVNTLDEAEAVSLNETCAHARLEDGQNVLELGCGWGSLTMWMAAKYPHSRITAVSNSNAQRQYIEAACRERNLANVRVITADMNDFHTEQRFDRIVSVEMFEHMRNYRRLLRRIAGWLRPHGRLFVHIFVHGRETYLFDVAGPANWLGRYFFTGGLMPADDLLYRFQEDLLVEQQWRQNGTHYALTANAWLDNFDRHRDRIRAIFDEVYGADAAIWMQRWRVFFMACAEMFGFAGGREWWVAHYLLAPHPAGRGAATRDDETIGEESLRGRGA